MAPMAEATSSGESHTKAPDPAALALEVLRRARESAASLRSVEAERGAVLAAVAPAPAEAAQAEALAAKATAAREALSTARATVAALRAQLAARRP